LVAQIDTQYKSYGFGKVFRRLISYGLFEGRPHTTKGQWFNPVVVNFLRLIKSVPGHPDLHKPIFITGLGRSGTTILGVILSLHKEVGFLNEPKAIWSLIDPRHDINGDYVFSGGKFHLSNTDLTDTSRLSAYRMFSRYLSCIRAERLVDKYPELIFRVDYLLDLFPDAKIIFITRNGCDAIHSIDLWSKRLGVIKDGCIEDWWGRNDIKWKYLREQIINTHEIYKHLGSIATQKLDHTNRAALEWIITMREGINQKKMHPNSVYQIKYEDILSYKASEIRKLLSWCDLSHDKNVLEYSEKSLYNNKSKPYPNLIKEIEVLFNETMYTLDY
jgi:hypothetical protein